MSTVLPDAGSEDEEELLNVKNELLQAMVELFSLPEIEPGEVTASMISEKVHTNVNSIKTKLDAMVEAGELTCREVLYKRHRTMAYRRK